MSPQIIHKDCDVSYFLYRVQMAEDEEERLSKHMHLNRTRTLQNLKIQKNVEGNNDSEDTVEV